MNSDRKTVTTTTQRRAPWIAALAAVVALAAVTAVNGQASPAASLGDAFQPEFLRRDLHTIAEHLELDDDQSIIVETLFTDYEIGFADGAQAVRTELGALRPASDMNSDALRAAREELRTKTRALVEEAREQSSRARTAQERRRIMERYQERVRALRDRFRDETSGRTDPQYAQMMNEMALAIEAWLVDRHRLREDFVLNIQAILSDEQRLLWPPLDRRLRREKTLSRGRLSGESTNVLLAVRDLEVPPALLAELEPIMTQYEVRLDEALQARNEFEREAGRVQREAAAGGNAESIRTVASQLVALRVAVRDINATFSESIAGMLPEPLAERFRRSIDRRAFEDVYSPTRVERMLRSAAAMDLEQEIRDAVLAIQAEYAAQLAVRNDELQEIIRRHEPQRERVRFERLAGLRNDARSKVPDPIDEAFEKRRAFGERYLSQLASVLSEEQLTRLPGYGRRKAEPKRQSLAPRPGQRRVDIMERFDLDKDGRLNDEERAAARQYLLDQQKDR